MSIVTKIGDSAFKDTKIKSITFENPDNIVGIGMYALYNCENLEGINIPNNVQSILAHTFENCTNLTEVNTLQNVNKIDSWAFHNCKKLKGVTISSKITKIESETFSGCTNLDKVNIPKGVTEIGQGAFAETALTSITIPSTVKIIKSHAFNNCTQLESVIFTTEENEIGGIEEIWEGAFAHTALKNVEIPGNVRKIGAYAFINCKELETVTFYSNNPFNYSYDMFWYRDTNEYKDLTVYVPKDVENKYFEKFNNYNFITQFTLSTY